MIILFLELFQSWQLVVMFWTFSTNYSLVEIEFVWNYWSNWSTKLEMEPNWKPVRQAEGRSGPLNNTLGLKKGWNNMRRSVWTTRLVPVSSPQECFQACQPAWRTPPARPASVSACRRGRLTFAVPPTRNVSVPVPPLTSDWGLSAPSLLRRQPYSTRLFHSALSPGDKRKKMLT